MNINTSNKRVSVFFIYEGRICTRSCEKKLLVRFRIHVQIHKNAEIELTLNMFYSYRILQGPMILIELST